MVPLKQYKISLQIRGSQPYVFHKSNVANSKHLSHYLLNEDAAKVLRLIYGDSSKEDLMNDDDIMQDFYGSAKDGNAYLASLDDETWENFVEEFDNE